jgi:hypothetical protein
VTRLQRLVAFVRDALVHSAPLPAEHEGPRSRVALLAAVTVNVVAIVFLVSNTRRTLRPVFSAPPPAPIRAEGPGDQRFELDEKTRKSIFAELAALELSERKRNIDQNTWNGHLWSREDDRGWQERVLARSLARRHNVSISQIFLVLEEGIRSKWPAPDGKPLPANVEPLNLRTGW